MNSECSILQADLSTPSRGKVSPRNRIHNLIVVALPIGSQKYHGDGKVYLVTSILGMHNVLPCYPLLAEGGDIEYAPD